MSGEAFPNSWSFLKHPYKRSELLSVLLSVQTLKSRSGAISDGDVVDDFDALVHVLFDDSNLAERPESEVGYILMDENEVLEIRRLCDYVSDFVDDIGDRDITTYLKDPRWEGVEARAKSAYDALEAGARAP